jgi:hypothetical protein
MRWIPTKTNQTTRVAVQDPAEANLVQFASFVLDGTQRTREHAKLVL